MRLLIIFALFLLTPALGFSKAGAVHYVKSKIKSSQALQSQALYLALSQRCLKYFNWLDKTSISNISGCESEAREFLKSLDISVIQLQDPSTRQIGYTTVAFKSELFELMQRPMTHGWLQEIESELQLASYKKFDLHAVSKKVLKSEILVLKMIAVLLQDTSVGSAHIAYLNSLADAKIPGTEKAIFKENLKKLMSVQNLFIQLQRNQSFKRADYRLYPLPVTLLPLAQSPTQYHYYVVAYNTYKMVVRPTRQDVLKSFFVNVAFNYLYEVMNAIQLQNIFHDRLQTTSKAEADIMLGYYGGLFGLGLHPQSIQFVEVKTSPEGFFKSILQELRIYFPLKR